MQKWEYKIVFGTGNKDISLEKEINRLGNQGWELVSVTENSDDVYSLFFKRQLK